MRVSWLLIILMLVPLSVGAEDGKIFVKNVSKTPDWDTDHATVKALYLNVPVQTSGMELLENVEYLAKDETLAFARTHVQPLIAFYHDGPVVHPDDAGHFPGHGNRDVYGAVSMDDGNTWKQTDLSDSGFRSSFNLKDGTAYPGDTFRLFANSAGNKVCVAWASRYSRGGNPNYAMDDLNHEALAEYLGLEYDDLYLTDYFGVSGSQKSSDFTDEDFPTVGEVPYACLWAARGTLEKVDIDGNYDENGEYTAIIWRKAERLTSGVRDVHRIEVGVAGGAGWVITWQEDPDGLRPGHGEGPGEGWSGAVAHHETDIWYSWIDWAEFDMVDAEDGDEVITPVSLFEFDMATNGNPRVGVPFSMPVRLSDNKKGAPLADGETYQPDVDGEYNYLYEDFDGSGTNDFCASTVTLDIVTPSGPTGPQDYCVTEDGRLLRGNTASTRCRVNLRGYDADGDGATDNAWVVMAYEESKGLGEEEDLDPQDLINKTDMGKSIWYHSFDMRHPELVSQGLMLNQPAVYPPDWDLSFADRLESVTHDVDGLTYHMAVIDPDPIYEEQDVGLETTLYQCEISRRFSLISQPASHVLNEPGKTVAFAMWKQGIVRQGGPADVFARRFIIPDDFDPTVDNPFGYDCMECGDGSDGNWLFTDGSNPRYVKGLCIAAAKNMTATSVAVCDDANTGCEDPLMYPFNEYFDDIDMSATETGMPKVYEWSQSGPDFAGNNQTWGSENAVAPEDGTNFNDLSWENPYEVGKGHRGYMSGDFILMLYGWSPNQLANAALHDNYQLYARRSFDGGATWTTTPTNDWASATAPLPEGVTVTAGTTEWYTWMGPAGGSTEFKVGYTDGTGGAFEPARDLTLMTGTRITTLDPRFAGTGGGLYQSITGNETFPEVFEEFDVRDPSVWFVTFEEGDNTVDPPVPGDMFYSRAYNYGDNLEVIWEDLENQTIDLSSTENDYYFDWMENKKDLLSAEASECANPSGTLFWAIYNAWKEPADHEISDSDGLLRRFLFLDEDATDDEGSGGGGGKPLKDEPPKAGGKITFKR